jgi:ATP-dependent DNA helicase
MPEYVLYAPLTRLQKDVYQQALNGGLRKYLIDQGMKGAQPESRLVDVSDDKGAVPGLKTRASVKGRRRNATNYVEENDDEYFERVAQGETASTVESVEVLSREHQMKQARKWMRSFRFGVQS